LRRTRSEAACLILSAVALVVALLPSLVIAQATPEGSPVVDGGPRFILRPADDVDGSYFTLEAKPGSSHTLKVVLANADNESLKLNTYVADAFTLVNGGFGVREADDPKEGTATWITYEAGTVSLEPGKGIERELTVKVPDGTAPGQYIAGVVLQTAEPIKISGSSLFSQIIRKSIAVFITVPGETSADFTLGTPDIQTEGGLSRLVVPVVNDGDVVVKPAGTLALTDAQGKEIFNQQVAMGSVYAGMETTLEVPLPLTLPDGDYQIALDLSDKATSTTAKLAETSVTLAREGQSQAPVAITKASVTPMPSADNVQFAAVAVTITNNAAPVNGAMVVLNVARDGKPVEDFTLANAVTLQQGETQVEQRYLPAEGWTAGEWSFTLTLESVDPQTGAKTTILTQPIDQTISIAGR